MRLREQRRMGLGRLTAGIIAVLACLLVAGVMIATAPESSPAASAEPAGEATTLRVGIAESIDSLNPFAGYYTASFVAYHLNYDYLVGYDPELLEPRPEFAESWSHSEDGKEWTFKIREGMKWQDGEPATARDVAFTFNYIVDNEIGAYTSYTTFIEKVTAPDDTTAVFTCSKPKADILQMDVPILPEHIWSKVTPEEAVKSFKNGPPAIGSGPFQAVENKNDQFVRFVANKDYWRGAPNVDELIISTYKNTDTMVQDLKLGVIDAAQGIPTAQFDSLSSNPDLTTNACVSWIFTQLSFNCYDNPNSKGNPVLLDQGFRQALQYAIDREKIASVAFSGFLDPGTTLLPPYSRFSWVPPAGTDYAFDPEKTKSMLEAAGYKDTDGDGFRETKRGKPLSLRFYASSDTPPDVTASKMISGWLRDVGVKNQFQVLDPGALSDRLVNYEGDEFAPDFDMYVWFWQGQPSPQFLLSLLTPEQIGTWSDTSWTDPRYTELFGLQSSNLDEASRLAQVQEMQQIAHSGSPYLILGYPQNLQAYNTAKWTGWVASPSGFEGYNGDVFYFPDQIDSYVQVEMKSDAPVSEGGSSTWIYVVIGIAIVVVVGGLILMRRRQTQAETE